MPRPPSDPELKSEFSARIKELLNKFKAREIASALQVRTQTIYNYRDGKNAPSTEIIRRAMETWPDFALKYRGKVFTLQDFAQKPRVTKKTAIQYGLWDAIKHLDSGSVEIEILRKEASSVQLGVRIYFSPRQLRRR